MLPVLVLLTLLPFAVHSLLSTPPSTTMLANHGRAGVGKQTAAMAGASTTTGGSSSCRPRRGVFIVFEGVDRCGKTTQSAMLRERLEEEGRRQVRAMRFPDRTTRIGKIIDGYLADSADLDDRAVHLLFSANRWEASADICRSLCRGETIVCDRYAYSGVAFSAAKIKNPPPPPSAPTTAAAAEEEGTGEDEKKGGDEEPLLSLEWCQNPDRGLPAPDCVIFLDLSQEEAEKRGGYGNERYEKRDMQIRVRKRFGDLMEMDGKFGKGGVGWKIVDASQSVEKVHDDVWDIVQKTIKSVEEQQEEEESQLVRKLWMDGYVDLAEFSNKDCEKENK